MQPIATTMQNAINAMIGKECWGIASGSGTGSMVNLSIGSKTGRQRALKNTHLTEDERNYQGEYGLFIQNCAWRLFCTKNGLLCSSNSENSKGGEQERGLAQLRHKRVVAANVDRQTLDLKLSFDGGLNLDLFCDCTSEQEHGDNYSIFTPEHTYTAKPQSRLVIETCSPAD